MNKYLVSALLFGGQLLGAAPSKANMTALYVKAPWVVASGTYRDGVAGCNVSLVGADRRFTIQYVYETKSLFVQLQKDTWHVPQGTPVAITLQVDQRSPITANAISPFDPQLIQFTVTGDLIFSFMKELYSGAHFRVSFPEGSEPDWDGNLSESIPALNVFAGCISRLMNVPATQPFGTTTQPFGEKRPTH